MDRSRKILKAIIFIATCAILALPLFVDTSSIVSTLFPRSIVFQLLVEISVVAYVFLVLQDPSHRPPWKYPIVRAFTFFIGMLFFTSIFSLNPLRSFWSTPEWMMGVVTYLHFYLWFLIIVTVFREWNDWKRFFLISVSVCTLVCLYGLAQYLQLPFALQAADKYATRIISTVGNPLYLSAYAMMNVFFAGVLFKRTQNIFGQWMLGASIVLFTAIIFLSGSRGVILSLGIAVLCSLLVYAITSIHYWKRYALGGLCVAIFIASMITLQVFRRDDVSMWSSKHLPPIIHRLLTKTFTDKARPILWQTAWQGFLDRPLVGWGHDNYGLVFATHVPAWAYGNLTIGEEVGYGNYKINQRETALTETWYDRAHTSILDTLTTTGLFGLGAYILFLATLFFTIIRTARETKDATEKASIVIVGCALAAYVLHTLTAFDTPMTYLMFVLGVGYIVFVTTKTHENTDQAEPTLRHKKAFLCFLGVSILLIVPLGVINGISYHKGRLADAAIGIMVHDSEKGIRHFQKALSGFSPINEYIRRELGFAVYQYVKKIRLDRNKEKTLLVFAIGELEKNIQQSPRDLESAVLLTALYRAAYSYDASYGDRAISLMKKMNSLYPRRRDVLLELVESELLKGVIDDAFVHAMRVVALDPTRGDAHWLLARTMSAVGEYTKMFSEIDKAIAVQYPAYTYGAFFLHLAQTVPDSQVKKALEYTNRGYALFPQTFDYRVARYILFSRIGDTKSAGIEAAWIQERDPSVLDALDSQQLKKGR